MNKHASLAPGLMGFNFGAISEVVTTYSHLYVLYSCSIIGSLRLPTSLWSLGTLVSLRYYILSTLAPRGWATWLELFPFPLLYISLFLFAKILSLFSYFLLTVSWPYFNNEFPNGRCFL